MYLPRGSIVSVQPAGTGSFFDLTEHNRAPVELSVERIESKSRMWDATLRRNTVAKKHTLSLSWDMLPSISSATVDGKMGAAWIKWLNDTQDGFVVIQISIATGGAGVYTYSVTPIVMNTMISDFGYSVTKRNPAYDLAAVNISFEEI